MKITDITTESYSWPRKRPIRNGKYTYTTAGLSPTRVETDEGPGTQRSWVGIGLGGVNRSLLERFKPLLIGEDPVNVERLWAKLWKPKLVGRRGMETRGPLILPPAALLLPSPLLRPEAAP
jgi:L-alanine-DL-glutamate epimerase-like enolase superfamily enzyme